SSRPGSVFPPRRRASRHQGGQCATVAFSAPVPVSERTSISAYLALLNSLEITVPSQPKKNPAGMDTRPGLSSGNQWKSTPWNIEALSPVSGSTGLPETAGDEMISAPAVVSQPERAHG